MTSKSITNRVISLMEEGWENKDIAITVGRTEKWVSDIRRRTIIRPKTVKGKGRK